LSIEENLSSPNGFEGEEENACKDKEKEYAVRVKTVLHRLRSNIVPMLTGAVSVHGKDTDHVHPCKITLDHSAIKEAFKKAAFNISEVLGDYQDAVHFCTEREEGTTTPLYDVCLVPSGKKVQFYKEPINADQDGIAYFHQIRRSTQQSASAARSSVRNNWVTPGKFFCQVPLTRGAHPEMASDVTDVPSSVRDDTYPLAMMPVRSDVFVQVHKKGDRISIWSDDGRVLTKELMHLVNTLKNYFHDDEFVLLGHLAIEDKGKPQSSLTMREWLDGKYDGAPRVTLYMHDLLYHNGEKYQNKPWSDRFDKLIAFADGRISYDGSSVQRVVPLMAAHRKEIVPTINRLKKEQAHCRVIAMCSVPYDLNKCQPHVYFQRNARINVVVTRVDDTHISGVSNFTVGLDPGDMTFSDCTYINGKKVVEIGKTLSTTRWSYPGDIVEVETEALVHDKVEDLDRLRAYRARVVKKVTDVSFPFYAETVIRKAKDNLIYYG